MLPTTVLPWLLRPHPLHGGDPYPYRPDPQNPQILLSHTCIFTHSPAETEAFGHILRTQTDTHPCVRAHHCPRVGAQVNTHTGN